MLTRTACSVEVVLRHALETVTDAGRGPDMDLMIDADVGTVAAAGVEAVPAAAAVADDDACVAKLRGFA